MNATEVGNSNNNRSPSSNRQRIPPTGEDDENDRECHQAWWTWTPSALSLQHKEIGQAVHSPVYYSSKNNELQWRILLFPRGFKYESRDYFSLFLELLTEARDFVVHANFAFYLRSGNGKKLSHRLNSEHKFSADDPTCGFTKYLRRSDMLDGFNSILCHVRAKKIYTADQSLTGSSSGNSSTFNHQSTEDEAAVYSLRLQQREHIFIDSPVFQYSRIKVSRDLESAIDNSTFSDVVLVAGGKMFRAHRIILAMRSRVFASMLKSEKEIIELEDINESILKEILRFIYTGSVSAVTGKLIIASRTYGLEDLHLLCQQELAKSICVQNAANILILADEVQANKLKLDAMRFITRHASEVIKTAAYRWMVYLHLHLIEELYRFEHTTVNASNHDQ